MTQEEKKFKLLKITDTKGNCNYVPFNNSNVQFYREHKQKLTREKQEKFSIEEVELSVEEAAAIGVFEAHQILNPPKKRGEASQQSNDIVAMLMKQNQELAERLAVIESVNKETKPTKK